MTFFRLSRSAMSVQCCLMRRHAARSLRQAGRLTAMSFLLLLNLFLPCSLSFVSEDADMPRELARLPLRGEAARPWRQACGGCEAISICHRLPL